VEVPSKSQNLKYLWKNNFVSLKNIIELQNSKLYYKTVELPILIPILLLQNYFGNHQTLILTRFLISFHSAGIYNQLHRVMKDSKYGSEIFISGRRKYTIENDSFNPVQFRANNPSIFVNNVPFSKFLKQLNEKLRK
jgi:hypothetical protein